jgi:glycine cleavage system transcriptional repressor
VQHYVLTAIGRDRPGIIAAVSEVLLARGINIEDSQMAILQGHFAMMLILAAPDQIDVDGLRGELDGVRRRLELESVVLGPVAELEAGEPEATHVVSVYGIDHPGIVHAVSSALAASNVTITDLRTHLVTDPGAAPLYAMVIEVAAPPEASVDDLLAPIGAAQGVEVTVRRAEADVL